MNIIKKLLGVSTLVYSFSAGPVFASYNQFNATLQLARQGDVTAQRELGEMYNKGTVVDQNISKAVGWYRKAASQGDARAQFHLGVLLSKGIGVEKNEKKAVA